MIEIKANATLANLRGNEGESLHRFMKESTKYVKPGRLLDWGCGKMPYKDYYEPLVTRYVGYDNPTLRGSTVSKSIGSTGLRDEKWENIIFTQVIQYIDAPTGCLSLLCRSLSSGGILFMAYPQAYPEIEHEGGCRFTPSSVEGWLSGCGMSIIVHKPLHGIKFLDFELPISHGLVAEKL